MTNASKAEVREIVVNVEQNSTHPRALREVKIRVVLDNNFADSKTFVSESPIPLVSIYAWISELVNAIAGEETIR